MNKTKICIYGAGSIGAYLAHAFHKSGSDVKLIARGKHLEAIQLKGLTFIKDGLKETIQFDASNDPNDFGKQDFIIITLKAHSVPLIVENFSPLLGDNTAIVSAVNGLPWWYFYKTNLGPNIDNKWIETVDPKGKQWKYFKPERAIGCVVYPSCEIVEPGLVKHLDGNRFSLGEPNSETSDRIKKLSKLLISGGIRAPIKSRLRDEIWIKMLGNCSFNIISSLTGASLDQIGTNPSCRTLVRDMMLECREVGLSVGAKFNISIEKRIDAAAAVIGHKPSTRQDIENNRTLELDPIISSILELARKFKINTPNLDKLGGLIRMKGELLGLYERKKNIEEIISKEYTPSDI